MKICKTCGLSLPVTEFSKHTGATLRASCKPCRAIAAKDRYAASDKTAIMAQYHKYKEARRITQRASYLVTAAKQRAKEKGIPYDLDGHRRELQEIMDKGVCQLTGLPFDMLGKQTWNSPSLDRIVPSLGYVRSNIRVILFSLNVMMHDWGLETVKKVMSTITKQE